MNLLIVLLGLGSADLLYRNATEQTLVYGNYSFVLPHTAFPFVLLHLSVIPSSLACLLAVGTEFPPSVYQDEGGQLQGSYDEADLTSFALGRSESFVQLYIKDLLDNATLYLGVLLPERPLEGAKVVLEAMGHRGELCPLGCSQHGSCFMGVCQCTQARTEQACSLKVAYLELGQNYDIIVPPGTYRFFTTSYSSRSTFQLSLQREQSDAQLFISTGHSQNPPTAFENNAFHQLDSTTPSLLLYFNPATIGQFGLLFSLRSSDPSVQAVVSLCFQQAGVASSKNIYVLIGALLGGGALFISCCLVCLKCLYRRRRIRHRGARVHVFQEWNQSIDQEKILFEPSKVELDPNAPQDCTICLDGLSTSQPVTELPCKHMFHTACINTWFERQNFCCVCKHNYSVTIT